MSGNTSNSNILSVPNVTVTEEEIELMIIDETKRSEFGFYEFHNPYVQGPFEREVKAYKLKSKLKKAYESQELLRKMRANAKREYLTQTRQLKTLQKDAAVSFRVFELKLQEHYSKEFAKSQPSRSIDIQVPPVSHVSLPDGESLDLKKFNLEEAFEELRRSHSEMYHRERQNTIEFIRESNEYHERKQREQEESDRQQQEQEQQSYDPRDNCGSDCGDLNCQVCSFVREQYEEWRQQQRECSKGDSDSDSYDSDYCAEFGYYPREYNWERECREAEEAREAAAAAEQQRREENMRDVDGEEEPREIPWDEWVAGGHVSEKCMGCGDLECSDCYSDSDSYDRDYYPREYNYEHEAEEAYARAYAQAQAQAYARAYAQEQREEEEAEYRREMAQMKHSEDMTYVCDDDDDDDDDHHEVVAVTASAASTTTGDICARKKAASKSNAAAAAKARIAKQQQKKGKKFVPIQITLNDNRSRHQQDEEATATLSRNKLEINLPKKNLQGASREAKKRYNQKWNSVNAQAKQSGARETRLTYLPGAITHECMEYDSSDCYLDY